MSQSSPPRPSTIGLIGGSGVMGRMFGRLFESDGYRVLVAGRSTDLTYEDLAAAADVVIVTVPIRNTVALLQRIGPHLRPGQLLSDFTSIKQEPVEAMLATPADVIGCHPVFGPMADPAGQNVVLCPVRPGEHLPWFRGWFESHGMNVLTMTPQAHDESMAYVQGLTHFLNIMFARTLQTRSADLDSLLQVCSPVYRLFFAVLCRILSGDAELYGQIQITNRENLPVVREFLDNGFDFLRRVNERDWGGITRLFEEAADFLGDYKTRARTESDFLIERLKELLEAEPAPGRNTPEFDR